MHGASTSAPTLAALTLAADAEPWRAAGFAVADDAVTAGTVRIELAGQAAGRRIVSWALHGLRSTELDGLPTSMAGGAPAADRAPAHPCGAVRLDHVVAFSPDLGRTVSVLEAAGLDLRRVREGPTAGGALRQAFFRVGAEILEVVEHPPGTPAAADIGAPARFWGLAFLVEDLDASARVLGPVLGEVRDAIQPGRRIATVRREAGLGLPVALISGVEPGEPGVRS